MSSSPWFHGKQQIYGGETHVSMCTFGNACVCKVLMSNLVKKVTSNYDLPSNSSGFHASKVESRQDGLSNYGDPNALLPTNHVKMVTSNYGLSHFKGRFTWRWSLPTTACRATLLAFMLQINSSECATVYESREDGDFQLGPSEQLFWLSCFRANLPNAPLPAKVQTFCLHCVIERLLHKRRHHWCSSSQVSLAYWAKPFSVEVK